jgi:hypothetical protein
LECNLNAKNKNPNPNNIRYPKSMRIPKDPKPLGVPNPIFNISKKNVKGEIKYITFTDIGINKGLIKINGNLMIMVRIIVLAGVSVGGTERIKLKEEKANAANRIPGIMINKFMLFQSPKNMIPSINGTLEKIHPNKKELHTFPNKTVFIETGHVINRSNVF